ncbi:hypothetical protein B296_00058987, partial [Ensete ventricosum]
LKDTEVAGNNYDGKQRKSDNRVDVLRRKSRRWALLAVNHVDVPEIAAFAGALARLKTGEAAGMGDFAGDLFRRKK